MDLLKNHFKARFNETKNAKNKHHFVIITGGKSAKALVEFINSELEYLQRTKIFIFTRQVERSKRDFEAHMNLIKGICEDSNTLLKTINKHLLTIKIKHDKDKTFSDFKEIKKNK